MKQNHRRPWVVQNLAQRLNLQVLSKRPNPQNFQNLNRQVQNLPNFAAKIKPKQRIKSKINQVFSFLSTMTKEEMISKKVSMRNTKIIISPPPLHTTNNKTPNLSLLPSLILHSNLQCLSLELVFSIIHSLKLIQHYKTRKVPQN